MSEGQQKINRTVEQECRYGSSEEIHHFQWAIDQMVRALIVDRYEEIVAVTLTDEDGPDINK